MSSPQKVEAFPTPSWFPHASTSSSHAVGLSDLSGAFPVIFSIVFFIWIVYTLVLAYHWFRYGHQSFLAVPMLAIHVVVSGILFLLATAGMH